MARFFNTAGPCRADLHYLLPPERRVAELRQLIDEQLYFVVHAPRQVGKSTSLGALAESLTTAGRYTALLTSCEVGQKLTPDLEGSIAAILSNLHLRADVALPAALRPPAIDPAQPAETRLLDLLRRWSMNSLRPVVLFLDEIDALYADALISVLRQLRAGYADRPAAFPQAVALIGMRDVRDYRLMTREDAAPFNVKSDSLGLRNFTGEEVAELYQQHTTETGQVFTSEAKALGYELTRGQPWLVNALAREALRKLGNPAEPVTAEAIERAKDELILRRDTHLDSLVDRLREERVRRVLEPILAGQFLAPDSLADDIQFVKDLGLVVSGPGGLEIANPIYREVIPRALAWVVQDTLPVPPADYVAADGSLLFERLLDEFQAFWCEHAEFYLERQPYSEAAAQLVLMAWMQRIVNGGGTIDREYGVGRGRIDLHLRWFGPRGVKRWAIELKVWRDGERDPLARGVEQLVAYLERLGLREGTLILFDGRRGAPPLPERATRQELEHAGRQVRVVRL